MRGCDKNKASCMSIKHNVQTEMLIAKMLMKTKQKLATRLREAAWLVSGGSGSWDSTLSGVILFPET